MKMTEEAGYEPAMVNVGGGRQKLMKDYRFSDRVMIDNKIIAKAIFDKIMPFLTPWKFWGPHSNLRFAREINERFRYLKYGPGQFFN